MSYADATLDFTSVSVACLAGPNGAGKSAMLDAITWALWEAARASSDELIRLGEKEMWVDLCFSHEGRRYRVRRCRQKSTGKSGTKSSSKGSLEFQIWNSPDLYTIDAHGAMDMQSSYLEEEGGNKYGGRTLTKVRGEEGGAWKSLTAASMRETQKAIDQLLRMDFDTFVNSAYLRQGRADEFTTRGATERKQVLTEILGLSYFDRLQEQARDKVRTLKARCEWLDGTINNLSSAQQELQTVEEQHASAQKHLKDVAVNLEHAERESKELQAKMQHLRILRERISAGEREHAAIQSEIKSLAKREEELSARHRELTELVDRSPEVEHSVHEFERLRKALEDMDQQALSAQDLSSRRMELQTVLARHRSKLELERDHLAKIVAENEEKSVKLQKDCADSTRIEEAYESYRSLVTLEADMSKRQEAFVQLTNRVGDLQNAIAEARIRLEAEFAQKRNAVEEFQKILSSRDVLEAQQSELQDRAKSLEKLEAEFELVEERGLAIKTDIQTGTIKIEELKLRQSENLEKIRELTCHSDSSVCPLCSAPIVDRAAVIERYKAQNEAADKEISTINHSLATLEIERNTLRREYISIKQKLESRKKLDTEIGQFNERLNAVTKAEDNLRRLQDECALLERRLSSDDFAQVERESLIAVKAELYKLDFDPIKFADVQSQLRSQRGAESRYQQLQRDNNELKRLGGQLPDLHARLATLSDELTSESYCSDVRAELHELQTKLGALKYDRAEHAELKARISELLPRTEQLREVQRAIGELPSVRDSLAQCQSQTAARGEGLPQLMRDLDEWRAEVDEAPAVDLRLLDLQPQLTDLRSSKDEASKAVAVAAAQCEQLGLRLEELTARRTELEATRKEADDYAFLAEAFGKKGIQAVIIENAVPEIESEANRILSRLTDNKMHVALVTQQRNKSGSLQETLEILIGDEVGTRSYEMYSGGEAFKVNFAIRVALSRLLARRSGAKLETLIIDEGFGSQDDVSRDRLVKAIRSIQSDFARILVITHIADVRDMFPMQIVVSKVHGTSQAQLVS